MTAAAAVLPHLARTRIRLLQRRPSGTCMQSFAAKQDKSEQSERHEVSAKKCASMLSLNSKTRNMHVLM